MRRRARRLAARFGLDRNPLRRRADRIASFVTAGLFGVFLAGAPFASLAAWHWAGHASMAEYRNQHTWHQIRAVVVQSVPVQEDYYYGGGSWSWGRWTAPAGHTHDSVIPVPAGARAGSHVEIWVDAAGQWSGGPPISRTDVTLRATEAAVIAPAGVAAVLCCLGCVVRFGLDRRRLAAWETAWTRIGPQWTRQF